MTGAVEMSFTSNDVRCSAWYFASDSEAFQEPAGRPCIVMAHGFGGTKDTGLVEYAAGFAAAGFDVLLFDYRGFGASAGQPRQLVSHRRQRADYHAAIAAARSLRGVDPERIALWGTSYSGGHVLPVAVEDGRIAAIVSLTPATDGLAALGAIARRHPAALLPLIAHGLRDAVRTLLRRRPHMLPVVGESGTVAMITAPGAIEGYTSLAGPTWRNEVCARTALGVAFHRPIRVAAQIRTPLLVQVGDHDAVAPPAAALRAAKLAGRYAEVRTYPVNHFDVYSGFRQRQMMGDQIEFLNRHLSTPKRIISTPERYVWI